MNDTAYKRLKEAAEREHRLNLDAIERVRRMEASLAHATVGANGMPGADKSAAKQNRDAPPRQGKGKLLTAVRSIVGGLDGDFARQTIEANLRTHYPDLSYQPGSLKAVLKRMGDDGEIKVVVKPQGRRAAKYRRGTTLGGR